MPEIDEPSPLKVEEVAAPDGNIPTAQRLVQGRTFLPQQHILLYSPAEWEEFIKEWVHYQKTQYTQVVRVAGAGDLGVDVAGFTDAKGFFGVWDCFQCKHYDDALTPTTAFPEIAKILWHSFSKKYIAPRKYYFIAPRGCGPRLKKLLLNHAELKASVIKDWEDSCSSKITSKGPVVLEGPFLDFVDSFDFSIFTFRTALEIIDEHRATPYHYARFGGGLPDRPATPAPPTSVQPQESRYVQQLYEAYCEEVGTTVASFDDLSSHSQLARHYDRQREYFYSAEALRNFARDTVPAGTFEELQSEVYAGVIDVAQDTHASSLTRLNEVAKTASSLQITSNGLISVTKIPDRKGICHQLANEDRLLWRKP